MNSKLKKILAWISIIPGIVIWILMTRQFNSRDKERSKYISILKIDTVEFVVNDFFVNQDNVFINNNGDKIIIYQSWNNKIEPNSLGKFLQKGDLVVKRKGINVILICRDNVGYYFRVGNVYYSRTPDNTGCKPPSWRDL